MSAGARPRTPLWVWGSIVGLACLQPAAHLWIRYAPPEGMVPTGLHTPDSTIFIQSMDMFSSGFHSAYATCHSPFGDQSPAFFPMPHQWFYGVQGLLAKAMGADPFLFYGFFNGLMVALYLFVVYRFMAAVIPRWAERAFLLYALGGGIGGVLYGFSRLAGLHEHAMFEAYFLRFALYELLEGEHLFPVTFYGRSYYLASIACCLAGLTLFHQACESRSQKRLLLSGLPFLVGAFINMRFGLFTAGILFLYLLCRDDTPAAQRMRNAAIFLVPGLAGCAGSWLLMRISPTAIQNHLDVGRMNMWFSPFLSCVLLFLLVIPLELWRRGRTMPLIPRVLTFAAMGYLVAFAALYIGYIAYYGEYLLPNDVMSAITISDWALLGALIGALWGARRKPKAAASTPEDWVVLWLLAFTCIALSAWGQGWFLRFGPQRMILMLYLPISMVAAMALDRMSEPWPRFTRATTAAIVSCGITSIFVSTFYFQAPAGRRPEPQAFDWTHAEVMTLGDRRLLDQIEAGRRVLASKRMADLIAVTTGNPVVFGIASFNMSDERYMTMENNVNRFFSTEANDDFRQEFVAQWCVDYVYCSDTWPAQEEVVQQLRESPWLEEAATEKAGALFRVRERADSAGA